ncbi:MAG: hypothetical protein R2752_16320 [Vicinamibacterales bacterium]
MIDAPDRVPPPVIDRPPHPVPIDRPRRIALAVAWALALLVVAAGVAYGSRDAGGSDSYGYVSQADLWLEGRLVEPAPWIAQVPWPGAQVSFTPLGYVHRGCEPVIVPQYSPGLPLLMAGAKLVAGHCAVFLVAPIAGGLLVLATFGLGRRLASPGAGLAAAWLVAASPVFLQGQMSPMSDVPVSAAWIACFWAVAGGTVGRAAMAGLLASLAILIRPNLAPIAAFAALGLAAHAWRTGPSSRGPVIRQLVAFAAGVVPGALIVAAVNDARFGSPLASGYGPFPLLFGWEHVRPNLARYLGWFVSTHTVLPLAGSVVLLVPARRLWLVSRNRWLVPVLAASAAFVGLQYLFYTVFEDWTFLRFFLPIIPLVMIGLALALFEAGSRLGRFGPLVAAMVIVLLGAWTSVVAVREHVFETGVIEAKYSRIGRLVREMTREDSVVISHQHSGSLRYYAGRMTINFIGLDPEWLDGATTWLAERGKHPWAVLEEWELPMFRERFAAANRLGSLQMRPAAVYRGASTVYIFDLLRGVDSTPTMEWRETSGNPRCEAPQPRPTLALGGPAS